MGNQPKDEFGDVIIVSVGHEDYNSMFERWIDQGKPHYLFVPRPDLGINAIDEMWLVVSRYRVDPFFIQIDHLEREERDKSGRWGKHGYLGPVITSEDLL